MKKFACAFLFAAFIVLIWSTLVWAGGWAVVTLDQLPPQVVAGQPIPVGFMVRQHGRTLLNGLSPKITATRADAYESFTVVAIQQGAVGHYAATLTFPNAGTWNWTINAFGFEQPMPTVTVLVSAPSKDLGTTPTSAGGAPSLLSLLVEIIGGVGAVGALALWMWTRRRLALALLLVTAPIAVFGFAFVVNPPAVPAAQIAQAEPAEVGRALFLAKGCMVCHRQNDVSDMRKGLGDFSVGPNLTNLQADPTFLQRWLKDPSAVKPGTEMPTLGLTDEEISALGAFLLKER